jgi:uncharacterized protein
MPTITPDLVAAVRARYCLDWHGIHGVAHWARVRRNGLIVAARTGADALVVELFAFVHDACRFNDGHDPDHGRRAAEFALWLRGRCFEVSDVQFALLAYACERHSDGLTEADVTVQACWDADRLDLGRVGIRPAPRYLCTAPAREPEVLEPAYARSRGVGRVGRT